MGVVAAKGDVKLHNQFEKEVFFYTFCIQLFASRSVKELLCFMVKGNWILKYWRISCFKLNCGITDVGLLSWKTDVVFILMKTDAVLF